MKKNTQFKINSVNDIKKHHYRYYKQFKYSLNEEIDYYKDKKANYMICDSIGEIYVDVYHHDIEVVPNPYTTKELEPNSIEDLMEKLNHKASELGFEVDISFKPKNK